MGGLIWLASYPKSGNTWARSFLHALIRGPESLDDINNMKQLTTIDGRERWYRPFLNKPIEDCTEEEVAAVRMEANEAIARNSEGLTFVKTHNAFVENRGAPMINLNVTAGVIYLVRNPLDVAVSYSHHLNVSVDETIQVMNTPGFGSLNRPGICYDVQGSWKQNVESWTSNIVPGILVLRYEDMVHHPVDTFGRLVSFLGVRISKRDLQGVLDACSFERLQKKESEHGFNEKPKGAKQFFRQGKTDQWRDLLTERQIDAIIDANHDQMKRFGYGDSRRQSAA